MERPNVLFPDFLQSGKGVGQDNVGNSHCPDSSWLYFPLFPSVIVFDCAVLCVCVCVSGIFRQREECRWCESYLMSSETFAIGTQRTHYIHAWQKWPQGTESLSEMSNTQKKMHRHRLFGGISSG